MWQKGTAMKWVEFLANPWYGVNKGIGYEKFLSKGCLLQDQLANKNKIKMYTTLEDSEPAKVREAFLGYKIDFSSVNPDEIACLLRMAVLKNDAEYAIKILDRVPEILAHDNGGGKILWHALENGNEAIAEKLIFAGADLNYRSRNGSTLLHRFMHKHTKLALLMISRGADVNMQDCSKKTVLYVAIEDGLKDVIFAILRLNIKYKDESRILELAASSDSATELLPRLIRSTSVSTKRSRARKALLHYLQKTYNGNNACPNLIRNLIEGALLPTYTNADVIAILKYIVGVEKFSYVVRILLDHVERLDGNCEDVALLMCQASKHSKTTISTLLIHKGSSVNGHTKEDDYPLHVACDNGSLQNIHLLISLGADLTVVNGRGHTPLGCMSADTFKEHHKLVIRHLAIKSCMNLSVHSNDIAKIRRHPRMRRYYEECVNELWKMRNTKIHGETTFFCFFDQSVEELAELARHVNFLKNYYTRQKEGYVTFPHYSIHMHNVIMMAIERKNILLARAKIYEQAIMDVPPYDNLSYVAHDMPDLENFERMFYLQLHDRINNEREVGYHANLLY